MILAIVALLVLAILQVFRAWRQIELRNLRWRFYALRDELRRLAIDDARVRDSALFLKLDRNLTLFARELEDFSLWKALPQLSHLRRDDVRAEMQRLSGESELRDPDNKAMAHIYSRTAPVLLFHFMWKHVGVAALFCLTGIGAIVVLLVPVLVYVASDELRIKAVSTFDAFFKQLQPSAR